MFTYCFNNPVNLDDSEGNWPRAFKAIATVIAVVVKAVNTIINHRNKKKIEKGLKQSYTPAEAERAINNIGNNSSKEVKATVTSGSSVEITNSYKVTSRYERQEAAMIIERTNNEDGSKFTERTADDLASEWLWHNIMYDVSKRTVPYGILQDVYKSSQSTNLGCGIDAREEVWIPSAILRIWGFE